MKFSLPLAATVVTVRVTLSVAQERKLHESPMFGRGLKEETDGPNRILMTGKAGKGMELPSTFLFTDLQDLGYATYRRFLFSPDPNPDLSGFPVGEVFDLPVIADDLTTVIGSQRGVSNFLPPFTEGNYVGNRVFTVHGETLTVTGTDDIVAATGGYKKYIGGKIEQTTIQYPPPDTPFGPGFIFEGTLVPPGGKKETSSKSNKMPPMPKADKEAPPAEPECAIEILDGKLFFCEGSPGLYCLSGYGYGTYPAYFTFGKPNNPYNDPGVRGVMHVTSPTSLLQPQNFGVQTGKARGGVFPLTWANVIPGDNTVDPGGFRRNDSDMFKGEYDCNTGKLTGGIQGLTNGFANFLTCTEIEYGVDFCIDENNVQVECPGGLPPGSDLTPPNTTINSRMPDCSGLPPFAAGPCGPKLEVDGECV